MFSKTARTGAVLLQQERDRCLCGQFLGDWQVESLHAGHRADLGWLGGTCVRGEADGSGAVPEADRTEPFPQG